MARLPEETIRQFAAWGRRGGEARASRLTSAQRRRIARKAARVRWKKSRRETPQG